MGKDRETDELFHNSNLMILICYTFFSTLLTVTSLVLHWIVWPIILINIGIVFSWVMFLKKSLNDHLRIWIYVILLMCSFFYYGTYTTSAYDLAIVMSAVIIVFTVTGSKNIITLCQITFVVTYGYCIFQLIRSGQEFDTILVLRTMMHFGMVLVIGKVSKNIIEKWMMVLNKSKDENDALMESTERLNDFLANVSHELRTPVNAIIGLTGICIDKEENDDIRKEMESVRAAGHKVADQISDILDYSEIDRNKLVINNEDYMLSSLMNDLVHDLKEYKKDGVELVIDIDPSIPAKMNTDVTKFKKILKSIIGNALKYTNDGGVYVKMDTETKDYGVNFKVEVTDTGIGMTAEELERIYDSFYQADSGRSRSGNGLGLGMSIVRGFISLLGGFMTVRSKVGEGTTVRISIPQTVVDSSTCMSVESPQRLCLAAFLQFDKFSNPRVREYYNSCVYNIVKGLGVQMYRVDNIENLRKLVDTANLTHMFIGEEEYLDNKDYIESLASDIIVAVVAESAASFDNSQRSRILEKPFYCFPVVSVLNTDIGEKDISMGRMVVNNVHALVVDDEPMNLVVAKSIFKRYGMRVTTVSSGMESVDICKKEVFDIIFMDHMMRGMDGVEAMKRIRSDSSGLNHNVPMVALTANAMSSARQMFMSEGFDGFVSKPIEIESLERTLKRLLPVSAISYIKEGNEDASETEHSEKAEPVSQPVTFRGKLKAANIDIETGLHYCGGDLDFYKTLLLQIATEAKDKIRSLTQFYDKKAWKDYEIIIHAVKSTTKTVGAMSVSEDALKLEKAATEGDEEYISANHERVLESYKTLISGILSALDRPQEESGDDDADDEVFEFGPDASDDSDEVFEFGPDGEED